MTAGGHRDRGVCFVVTFTVAVVVEVGEESDEGHNVHDEEDVDSSRRGTLRDEQAREVVHEDREELELNTNYYYNTLYNCCEQSFNRRIYIKYGVVQIK